MTLDLYIVTCFFVKFYTRTYLDELMWKPHGNKKKKQKKKQREAEVEQELSGEVAGGGRSSSIHAALEQLGQYPARGDDSLCRNGTWYSVCYRQEL